MRKTVSVVISLILVCILFAPAYAAELIFSADYTGVTALGNTKPTGFDSYGKGGSNTTEAGAKFNVFGKGQNDESGFMKAGSSLASYKPYVRKTLLLDSYELHLAFSAAAADKDSEKVVYIKSGGVSNDDALMALRFSTDGKIYSFGTCLAGYETEKWYHFDIEFADGVCKSYINGVFAGQSVFGDGILEENVYLYYGIYNNTNTSNTGSVFYVDDFELSYGSVPDDRKIGISSQIYEIKDTLIGGIEENTGIEEFINGFETNALLSVIDSDGNVVSDGAILPDMSLVLTSKDGVNSVSYQLDCINLKFDAPENGAIVKSNTQEIGVSFSGEGSVKFYVNDVLIRTVSEKPYTVTAEHTAPGGYTVYAVITTAEGVIVSTERRSYTYSPNIIPRVALSGITNGAELGINDILKLKITAADDDGDIVETALYVDGRKMEGAELDIGPLSVGVHEIYAVAVDNEGGTGRSASYFVSVIKRTRIDIFDKDTFSGATSWQTNTDGTVAVTGGVVSSEDEHGEVYKITSANAEAVMWYFNGSISQIPIEGYSEIDMRLSNTNIKTEMFSIRHTDNSTCDFTAVVQNGLLCGNESCAILPNEWYHYKYYWNAAEKTTRIWLLDKATGEYILAAENTNMDTDGTFGGLRFYLNRNKQPADGYSAEFDNFELYCMQEAPYVVNTEYLKSNGESAASDGLIGCGLSEIRIHFNNKIAADTVTTDNISLFANGEKQRNYYVTAEDNTVTIILDSGVQTLSSYIIAHSGIADIYGEAVDSGTIAFETGAAEYDCLGWSVKNQGKEISGLNNIKKGDVLTVSAKITNQSNTDRNSVLIFAAYSGNKLVGLCTTGFTAEAGKEEIVTSKPLTISGVIDDSMTLYGYIWSDMTAERQIQINSFKMSD